PHLGAVIDSVPAKQGIVRRPVPIDSPGYVINVSGLLVAELQYRDSRGGRGGTVGPRNQIQIRNDCPIDCNWGYFASYSINNLSVASIIIRNLSKVGHSQNFSKTFIVREIKDLVVMNRSTDHAAKLVALEWRNGICWAVKEVLRVQRRVSQKLKNIAVNVIG